MALDGRRVTGARMTVTLDHVAVAAHRIRDVLPIYRDLLRGEFIGGGDNERVGYRGVQFRYPDGSKIEVLEPLAGSAFLDRFLARGGGVHHLTFRVDDLDEAVAALAEAGYTPTGLHTDGEDWREVFLHPRETHGTLIQLAQAGPGYRTLLSGVTLEDVLTGRGVMGNGIASP